MKDITLSDIPCLKDYEEVKRRLFVRLWNRERMKGLFLGTCHVETVVLMSRIKEK